MKRIIRTTVLGTLTVAAILTSGCTKNYYDNPEGGGEENRITLSSEVQFGVSPRLQDEQIVSGQSLSFFVTRTGSVADEDQLYLNNRITANGVGGFTYRIPMYYPSDGASVDFYALHPYAADATLENPVAFTVQPDQTIQVNYLNSDLLFGTHSNVNPQNNAIPLTFYHKLSKFDFIIKTGTSGIDLNGLTGIQVLGTRPQTTINVLNGNITAASGSVTPIQAYGEANVTGSAGNQTATGFTAIVVPQTVAGAEPLFNIVIGGTTYTFTQETDYALLGGKKYIVTLDITDLTINIDGSQIEDWENGGSIGGPAGQQ